MTKYITTLAVFSLLLLFTLSPALMAGGFSIILDDETLSVSAENVALQTILFQLAAEGISIRIDPQINPLITANFKNRPVEQALESLIRPASYSLLWKAGSKNDAKREFKLAEIQIFQSGRKNLMMP